MDFVRRGSPDPTEAATEGLLFNFVKARHLQNDVRQKLDSVPHVLD